MQNLKQIALKVCEFENYSDKRKQNLISYIKQYSELLGFDNPEFCFENDFSKSESELNEIIARGLDKSARTIRNMKSELKLFLKSAVKNKLISLNTTLVFDNKTRRNKPLPNIDKFVNIYRKTKYRLKSSDWSINATIQKDEWVKWMTSEYVEKLEYRNQKVRKITCKKYISDYECYFGFLHNIKNIDIEKIDFKMLSKFELIEGFVEWHINVRCEGRTTSFIHGILKNLASFNRHYYKFYYPEVGDKLSKLRMSLSQPIYVKDKKVRIAKFEELMSCAMSEFPDRKIITSKGIRLALRAQIAIAIMLFANIPLRNSNFREAQLGKHIYKDENGLWHVHFTGEEGLASLKKSFDKNGRLNQYKAPILQIIVPYIEEYLDYWRRLITDNKVISKQNQNYFFLNTKGKPFEINQFSELIQKVTYKWLEKRVNPHSFRHSIASQRLVEGGSIEAVSTYLNDEPGTIQKEYFQHLQDDANKEMQDWMNTKFKKTNGKKKKDDEDNNGD